MNDCISRAALLEAFDEMEPAEEYEFEHGMWLDMRLEVVNTHAVNPEVPHGRWAYYHKQNKAVCTNCSFERDLDTNFGAAIACPNCGARMDGDGNG